MLPERLPNRLLGRLGAMISDEGADVEPVEMPDVVGHYKVGRRVGTGASAHVYEAEDLTLRRRVALKVLREDGDGRKFIARFHREASLAAGMRHPHIATVHEVSMVSRPDGRAIHFIVMDFLPATLAARVAKEKLGAEAGARLMIPVCRAVHHAHEKGIIHRDLKPGNILMDDDGRPVVTDFGLAKDVTDANSLTRTGAAMGTPMYMSPEQIAGQAERIGPAADIYALGVILFEVVSGRVPFDGATAGQLFARVLRDEAPALPDAPAELAAICRKALEKEARDRYRTAEEMARDLERYLAGEPVLALNSNAFSRIGRTLRRHPARIAGVLTIIASILATAILVPQIRGNARRRADVEAAGRLEAYTAARDAFDRYARSGKGRDEAARKIDEAIAADPDRVESWLLKARLHSRAGEEERAVPAIAEALKRKPGDPGALFLEAKVRSLLAVYESDDAGLMRKAEEAANRMEACPDVSPVEKEFIRGLRAVSLDKWTEAVARFTEFLRAEPGDLHALYFRARALNEVGDYAAALRDADVLVALQPKPRFHRARAANLYEMRKDAEALEALAAAGQEMDPTWHWLRGLLLDRMGRTDASISAFTASLRLAPGAWQTRLDRAVVLLKRRHPGDVEAAMNDCNNALESTTDRARALGVRSFVYEALNRPDLECVDMEEAVESMEGAERTAALGRIAQLRYQIAISMGHGSAGYRECMERAHRYADRALQGQAPFPYPYLFRALARYELARGTVDPDAMDAAKADARKYLDLAPDGPFAAQARALLARISKK